LIGFLSAMVIAWVPLSEKEIRVKCYELTGKMAVACMELTDNQCTIYAPPIRHEKDDWNFVKLGEETAHCFLGDFHKNPNILKQQKRRY